MKPRALAPALILTVGTAMGQLAPLLALPFLTRVYSAGTLGEFATYLAWANFLSIGCTLTLENGAIGIDDPTAAHRLLSSITTYALLIAVPLAGFALFLDGIALPWRIAIFWLVIASNATSTIGSLSFMYHRDFNQLAGHRSLGGLLSGIAQVLTAYLLPGIGALLVCYVLSDVVIALGAARRYRLRPAPVRQAKVEVRSLVAERPDLLRETLPTYILTNLGIALPQLGMRYVFDAAAAGQYFLARRVLTPPFQIAGKALGDFYFASTSTEQLGGLRRQMRIVVTVATVGVGGAIVGALFVISHLLGSEYGDVPLLLALLAPSAGAQLISTAFGRILIHLREDRLRLRVSALRLTGFAIVLTVAAFSWIGTISTIALLSAIGFLTYGLLFSQVWRRVG